MESSEPCVTGAQSYTSACTKDHLVTHNHQCSMLANKHASKQNKQRNFSKRGMQQHTPLLPHTPKQKLLSTFANL